MTGAALRLGLGLCWVVAGACTRPKTYDPAGAREGRIAPSAVASGSEPGSAPSVGGCGDSKALAKVVALALEGARKEGARPAALEGCDAATPSCEAGPRPLPEATSACQVVVTAGSEWSITIVPPPSAEAPRKIEVWTEQNGSAVRRVSVSGDSWAVSADGRVKMLGHGVNKVHDHGGPPAFIGSAGFEIQSDRDTPVQP